jgi:hypothetical protein
MYPLTHDRQLAIYGETFLIAQAPMLTLATKLYYYLGLTVTLAWENKIVLSDHGVSQ